MAATIFFRLLVSFVVGGSPCADLPLIPAYSHNDYRNERPLLNALDLGYQGAEVDLLRVGDSLHVGHDRGELRASRTLARMYLDPLRGRFRRCGFILADSTAFLLTVDLKEQDDAAFRLLLNEISRYSELFRPVRPGAPLPVRVALVGWWPPANTAHWPDGVGVQLVVGDDGILRGGISGRPVSLITIAYGRGFSRAGRGEIPAGVGATLAEARRLAAAHGVPLRVHHAPTSLRVPMASRGGRDTHRDPRSGTHTRSFARSRVTWGRRLRCYNAAVAATTLCRPFAAIRSTVSMTIPSR